MQTTAREIENPLTKQPMPVAGVKVQIWVRFNETTARWEAICQNLAGVRSEDATYDGAVSWCVHKLCERVNEYKAAHANIPWIDIGRRTPSKPDTIVLYKGIS